MPSPAQWFRNQVREYRNQRAIATQAGHAARLHAEQQRNTPPDMEILGEQDKELAKLEHKQQGITAFHGKMAQYGFNDATATADSLNDRGKGVGGFLGRLFSGRLTQSSRNAHKQQFQQMLDTANVSAFETSRIAILQQEKAARINALTVMKDAYGLPEQLKNQAIQVIRQTDPGFTLEDEIFSRLAVQCMRDGDLQHNQAVCQAFSEYRKGVRTPALTDAVHGYLQPLVNSLSAINPDAIDINNPTSIWQHAALLTQANQSVHAIADLVKNDPNMGSRLFGTAGNYVDFNDKAFYMVGLYRGARANLIRQLPDDQSFKQYATTRAEVGAANRDEAANKWQTDYQRNNGGTTTLEAYGYRRYPNAAVRNTRIQQHAEAFNQAGVEQLLASAPPVPTANPVAPTTAPSASAAAAGMLSIEQKINAITFEIRQGTMQPEKMALYASLLVSGKGLKEAYNQANVATTQNGTITWDDVDLGTSMQFQIDEGKSPISVAQYALESAQARKDLAAKLAGVTPQVWEGQVVLDSEVEIIDSPPEVIKEETVPDSPVKADACELIDVASLTAAANQEKSVASGGATTTDAPATVKADPKPQITMTPVTPTPTVSKPADMTKRL